MKIAVRCPRCQTEYRLNPELRGQRILCPNLACGEVFEAWPMPEVMPGLPPGREEQRGTSAGGGYVSGSVGELVPIIPAEPALAPLPPEEAHLEVVAPTPPAPTPPEPGSGPSAPTPRRSPAVPSERTPRDGPPHAARRSPKETLPAGTWADTSPPPPPVRRGPSEAGSTFGVPSPPTPPPPLADGGTAATQATAVTDLPPSEDEQPNAARRRAPWLIALMLSVLVAVLGTGAFVVVQVLRQTEEALAAEARRDYQDGAFGTAEKKFRLLESEYPGSEHAEEYRFWSRLCAMSRQTHDPAVPAEAAMEEFRRFLRDYEKDPLFKQWRKDHPDDLTRRREELANKFLERAQEAIAQGAMETATQRLAQAEQLDAEGVTPRPGADRSPLREKIRRVQELLARAEQRRSIVAQIRGWLGEPTASHFEQAEELARRHGLQDDAEVRGLLQRLFESAIAEVAYVPAQDSKPMAPPSQEEQTLLFVPRLTTRPSASEVPETPAVVFALVQGRLYALAGHSGEVLWTTSVGVDTATLPVRIPASSVHPEMVLVVSSDIHAVTAREVLTGRPRWCQALPAPCLARPLVVGSRTYVPTVDGQVHEIETVAGHRLCSFRLGRGQRLTVGGAWQPGTSWLFFPADGRHVYVLDKGKRRGVAVMQTGHPSGSIRGEPIIAAESGYLILSQADGIDRMQLRAFPLPMAGAPAAAVGPAIHLPGWSWFAPVHDGEKVVLATDAGCLHLVGINQPGNRDTPLFPYLPESCSVGPDASVGAGGRALVVYARERDFWVLARGGLQRWRLGIGPKKGLQLAPVWPKALPLGSPMHAGQVVEPGTTLVVTTQAMHRPVHLVTAVAADSGAVRWQRQVGLMPAGDPVLVGGAVVLLDQGGSAFVVDPSTREIRAFPWTEPVHGTPLLMSGGDGRSAVAAVG
ncbi:MAG: PQQ-binding-like beta-propeller repeat protein, partial [Gemmataceae bacterium]|nr:PQQ-binding-like beta-propeller repeat protein [Gemmataceae bacterium]MDW8265856.1 PQQ-binding-like beta-propeller repeat protein [Gemmataceae bacterium]